MDYQEYVTKAEQHTNRPIRADRGLYYLYLDGIVWTISNKKDRLWEYYDSDSILVGTNISMIYCVYDIRQRASKTVYSLYEYDGSLLYDTVFWTGVEDFIESIPLEDHVNYIVHEKRRYDGTTLRIVRLDSWFI